MAVDWRAYLPIQDTYEENLLDVYTRDGYDRFARKADLLLDDPDGTLRNRYTRGTPVRLEVDDGTGWETEWAGFVVDPTTKENETEVELYGHDLWLRKRNVLSSYEERTIEYILEDLITRLTPLKWNPDLVQVDDNQTLSIGWKGQQLDEVINELASYSGGEYFGANNDREFFFLQLETEEAPRNFGPASYVKAEFDEDGTREVNQVTLYYNDGNDAITVDDRDSQQELSNNLNTEDNVVLDVTRSYPDITSRVNARRKAKSILQGRNAIRTGVITTWEGFDLQPGQSTYVDIEEHDVDREMRVAQTEYWWMDDKTKVTVAGGGGDDVVDTLVDLSDQVERIEQQGANEDADLTRFISQDLDFELDFELKAYKRTIPDDQLVLGHRNGNLGHTDVGGGFLGDQAGDWQEFGVNIGQYRDSITHTGSFLTDSTSDLVQVVITEDSWDTYTSKDGVQAESWLQGTDKLQMYPDVGDHYWHLNNGSYVDVGTNGTSLDLTEVNTVSTVSDGVFGQDAVSGEGSGYLEATNGSNSIHSSMTAWVWFRGIPTEDSALMYSHDPSDGSTERFEMLVQNDGSIQVYGHGDSDETLFGGPTPNDSVSGWNLLVFQWDGSNGDTRVYLNGSDNVDETTLFSSFNISTYTDWYLGHDPTDGVSYSGDLAVAGVEYTQISEETIDAMAANGPANYLSETFTHGSAIKPTITIDADMPSTTDVTVAAIGSPGTVDEERQESIFTSGGSYWPEWNTSHTDFRLEVLPNTKDKTATPTVNKVYLKA